LPLPKIVKEFHSVGFGEMTPSPNGVKRAGSRHVENALLSLIYAVAASWLSRVNPRERIGHRFLTALKCNIDGPQCKTSHLHQQQNN